MKNQARTLLIICCFFCCSNIALAQVTYYLKSSGGNSLTTLSKWGTNTDGTGTAPLNFTTANQVFIITNVATASLTNMWSVTGAGSKVILGQVTNPAINFTISGSGNFVGTIDVADPSSGANTITLQNANTPVFGTLSSTSIINTFKYY